MMGKKRSHVDLRLRQGHQGHVVKFYACYVFLRAHLTSALDFLVVKWGVEEVIQLYF